MRVIVLKFEYEEHYIKVPEIIFNNIKKIRKEFDKWLYDKNNNHGYWVIVNGVKKGVSYDASVFIDYLNNHYSNDSKCKIKEINKGEFLEPYEIKVELF